jgi:secreted trypsin-like serine protease
VQIGITSLGASDCDTHLPDIFTRIDRIEDSAYPRSSHAL